MVQLKIIILFLAHRNRNKLIEATRHHGFRSWHCLLPRPPESHPCQKPLHNCRLETFTKAFTLASAKPSISKTSACVIGDRLPLLVRTLVLRALPPTSVCEAFPLPITPVCVIVFHCRLGRFLLRASLF